MKTIQSIDKAISVLQHISKKNGKLTLTDISTSLDMKITTLHGIISTLEYRGFLYKNPKSNKYHLGVKLFEMGKIYESDISLIDTVHPFIEKLADEFSETIHLAVPFENKILYVDKVESKHQLRLTSMVGTVEKAYNSAIGLVILAHLSKPNLEKFMQEFNNKEAMNEKTPQLMDIFNQIRQNGFYIKFEPEHDFYCIASPLINSKSIAIGAISIVIPNHRYNEQLSKKISDRLKEISDSLKDII
ncbi:MAG: IclR family transcriptional regulator [Tepidibacter sp.]|jgi:DNA-binding IclR family transcriptional regulator|uniref:IclR family transcriptional regulator n=1 Tax=Tepidibacter sp. TaxID=2529387 RepID=UPI0025D292D4|nr:IclR family transcriptional regulator [Tepidibacter sp.]MCT4509292.1 IclR family transcriptional regulator [Tepidibacter sp.]